MKKTFYLMGLALMGASFQSCSNDIELVDESSAQAYLNVIPTVEGEDISRAAKSSWNSGDVIGWYLGDGTTSTTYIGNNYMNKKLTYTTTWALEATPKLTGTEGTLYAYYPWDAAISDFATARTINITSQTDYMYGKVEGLKATNATANITMMHALSQLKVIIKKGTYAGAGNVTSLKVKSNNLSTSGSWNMKTGAVTMDTAADIAFSGTKTITADGVEWSSIVVQGSTAATPVFTVVMDGVTYTVNNGTSFTPAAGQIATYTITCTSADMKIGSTVTLTPWGSGASGTGSLQ